MRKNKSVIWGWVISYIIIFSVPIVLFMAGYFYNVKVIKKEIYDSNELVLNNLADNIDNYFSRQYEFYEYVVTNDTLNRLMAYDEKNASFYHDVKDFVDLSADYTRWNTQINCLIYFNQIDYVVGEVGSQSSNYYNIYYKSWKNNDQSAAGYDQWLNLLRKEYRKDLWVGPFLNGAKEEQCIVYANSIYTRRQHRANVFISVPVTEIERLMENVGADTKLVISIDNSPVLTVSSEGVVESADVELSETGAMFETSENMVIRRSSSEKGVEYYMLIPTGDFWKKYQEIRNLFVVSMMIALGVGGGFIYMFIRRNYRPLLSLYSKMSDEKGRGNEFQEMEDMYGKLIAEKSLMQKRILASEDALQRYYLLALMRGKTICLQNKNNEAPVCLKAGEGVVLAGIMLPMADDIVFFAVDNIFTELMEQEHFYRIEEGQCLLYVLRVSEAVGWREQFMDRINYMRNLILEHSKIELSIAVSEIEYEIEKINLLYKSVVEELEHNNNTDACGKQTNINIVNEIIKYVEMHYAESSLNIQSIADGVSRNPKYISKVFRDETGNSILDHIHNIRIQKAKILMQTENDTLEEIAEKVGYASYMTFHRAFIKINSVAPGKYKEGLLNTDTSVEK